MCGRFALYADSETLARHFQCPLPFAVAPRYNVAPGQPILALKYNRDTRQHEWTHFQWGLVPAWASDPSIGNRMINARSETVAEKPAFRNALRYRRCIVPVNGFFEWKKEGRTKQPYFVRYQDHRPMGLAGLWEHWQGVDGTELLTCTIITTDANELIHPLHDRMAVILPPEAYSAWLDPETPVPELLPLLKPTLPEGMIAYPVSPRVSSVMNDDPSLVEPLSSEKPQAQFDF